jgi:protein KTI12
MALVTIVGFPCCGKSTRAKQIKEYLEKRIADETEGPKLSVVLVDDDNSHVPRSTYDSMSSLHLHYGTELG